jgi:hypothetical protein
VCVRHCAVPRCCRYGTHFVSGVGHRGAFIGSITVKLSDASTAVSGSASFKVGYAGCTGMAELKASMKNKLSTSDVTVRPGGTCVQDLHRQVTPTLHSVMSQQDLQVPLTCQHCAAQGDSRAACMVHLQLSAMCVPMCVCPCVRFTVCMCFPAAFVTDVSYRSGPCLLHAPPAVPLAQVGC